MSTHEITAADCSWADINFESPKEAFTFADRLEQRLKDPTISDDERKRIDDALDDLFSTLFDCMF
jgi:hypothetical protein